MRYSTFLLLNLLLISKVCFEKSVKIFLNFYYFILSINFVSFLTCFFSKLLFSTFILILSCFSFPLKRFFLVLVWKKCVWRAEISDRRKKGPRAGNKFFWSPPKRRRRRAVKNKTEEPTSEPSSSTRISAIADWTNAIAAGYLAEAEVEREEIYRAIRVENISEDLEDFGEIFEVWNSIFGNFYN